ncbi:MAG TPA: thiamine diphosphokinase [Halanaerobiales bacterium]|nr:thiamine diphosphokinase [Halanaerobiales bacterium]
MKEVLVVLNGVYKDQKEKYQEIVNSFENIIAVDGGYKFLKKFVDTEPDTLIGDFDSIDRDSAMLKDFNGEIYEFPSDKDKTDGELSIDYCVKNGLNKISFIGATGGRIDQQFGNLLLLEYALNSDIDAKIIEPGLEVGLIDNKRIIDNKKGNTLSLFSITDQVLIKKLKGCKYELDNYWLERASSRGLSNIINANKAVIEVDLGKLLYFVCEKC